MVGRRCEGRMLVCGLLAIAALTAAVSCTTRCGFPEEAVEAVLRTNLELMREAVSQYERDSGCLRDLEQLVADGYLRRLPRDPFAAEGSTWLAVRNDAGCIQDVRSTSTETAWMARGSGTGEAETR